MQIKDACLLKGRLYVGTDKDFKNKEKSDMLRVD